jgi:hypothetical protein
VHSFWIPLIFAAKICLPVAACAGHRSPRLNIFSFSLWLSFAREAGLLGHAAIFACSGFFSKISFSSTSIFLGLSPQRALIQA